MRAVAQILPTYEYKFKKETKLEDPIQCPLL
jgi:hypothetical protein